ncbi:hypothetical protein FACS1894202_14820 [Clostridia bacterium]|nr:hypothetical protein FACS1894202_14820 [Clostridia bacterium]
MYHIVCKTLTNAQRAAGILGKNGERAVVKRLPSELREDNGCGYAIRVDSYRHALKLLDGMEYGRVFSDDGGVFTEVKL